MSGTTSNLKNYEERIVRDGGICGGEPVSKRQACQPCAPYSPAPRAEIPPKTFFPIFLS